MCDTIITLFVPDSRDSNHHPYPSSKHTWRRIKAGPEHEKTVRQRLQEVI